MSSTGAGRIPVCRPLLPDADALLPYLRRIDGHRWYTNFGPLAGELGRRIADRLQVSPSRVVMAANATAALTAVMMPHGRLGDGQPPLALMPSWTFVATAHAAETAGLMPFFADVDPASWQLTPDIARAAVAAAPRPVAAVVVVSPFGAAVDLAGWERFGDETGIAVIVDAAAGFDTAGAGRLTTVVSLHATKALPAGEGAFIVCPDESHASETIRRINFGFHGSRDANVVAGNSKISEYHAAVGLAALDQWPARRQAYRRAIDGYRERLGDSGICLQDGVGAEWVTATLVATWPGAAAAAARLAGRQVETRAWWGNGCHAHAAFAHCPRLPLPATARLAADTIGLPLSLDITAEEIDRIAAVLREG
ncbi:MAG: DegT/DnrJ/EryC1/StrS family aminotransferase [Ferrovibrionaceae bacterium]